MSEPRHILTVSDQPKLLAWAARRCENPGGWSPGAEAIGAVEAATGKICAVMVVDGRIGDAALIHFATDGGRSWGVSRQIVSGFFAYLFEFKRLPQVIGMTPHRNTAMLKMLLQAGFQIEGRVRRSQDGTEQDIVTSMFPGDCPWLRGEGEDSNG